MRRDYKVYLEDILEAAKSIRSYATGFSFMRFSKDKKTVDAVVRNLEVIGEAVKNVPPNIRQKYPDIEWRKAAGLRDILIHEYFGIDLEIVWDIVQHKIPLLEKQIKRILRRK